MADIDQINTPPPGFTLREAPQFETLPAFLPPDIAPPPGFTLRGATQPLSTDGMKELERRQSTMAELQKVTEQLPDPAEEKAGLQNSYFYSHSLGIPLSEANVLREEIAKEVTGDDGTKQKNFWNKLADAVETSAKSGHSGIQAGLIQEQLYEQAFQLSLEALTGNWNKERYNRIVEMQKQIHALSPSEDTTFLNQVLWDVGQIMPGMIQGMGEGALYGLGTAAAGAITGTVVPGIGTTAGAGGGFLFGFTAGMASHSFRQMRGQSWLTLSQMRDEEGNPIPQSIVQLVSFTAGALNAAIEVGQMGALIKTIPGAGKLLNKSVGNALDEIIKDGTLRQKLLTRMAEYGRYWTEEVSEEILQEIVDIVSEHVAKDLSNVMTKRRGARGGGVAIEKGTQFEHSTVMEDYKRLADTFIHTAPAMAILGLPGNVVGTVQDIAGAQQEMEKAADERLGMTPEDDELLRTAAEGYRAETTTPETPEPTSLSQRLARAAKERIIQAPVNERLAIANQVEDVQERERILSGEIPISEILEPEESAYTSIKIANEEKLVRELQLEGLQPQEIDDVLSGRKNISDVVQAVLQRTGVDIVPGETLEQQAKRRGLPIEEVESHQDAVSAAVDEAGDRISEIIGKYEVEKTPRVVGILPSKAPGVWYHGTRGAFKVSEMKIGAADLGIYITREKKYAQGFTTPTVHGEGGKARMIELQAKPQKTLDMRFGKADVSEIGNVVDHLIAQIDPDEIWADRILRMLEQAKQGLVDAQNLEQWAKSEAQLYDASMQLSQKMPKEGDATFSVRPLREAIQDLGYDSVRKVESGTADTLVVLDTSILSEMTAKKAYAAGKKIGTQTERERKAELLQRASEKKKLRAYINKLAAQIAREPGKSIDFFYREAIESLQTDIDPHFRRADTLEARERTREFIQRRPEAEEMIPKKVLNILEKRSLNEVTVAELELLRNEIDLLKKIGRTKKQLEIIQGNKDFGERRDMLVETVLRGEELTEETQPVVKATKEKGKLKKAIRFARAFTLGPSRIFDKLDRGKQFKGEFHRIFYDEVNQKENQKIVAVDERLESGQAKRKELGIGLGDLVRTKTEIDGVKYTLDEALDIYAGMKNESKTLALVYGNNIDPKIAKEIISSLTEEEKAFADSIIADYEKRYEALRNAHIEFMDEDLGHEKNYTPIRRTDIDYEALNEELRDELLRKTHLKKGYAEKGFTVSRQDIPPEFQKPIRLGLYVTWLDQVPKQEHYIFYANKIRDMHRLLNDKQLSAAIRQKYGDEYYDAIRHYTDRVANPTIYKTFHKMERISQTLRKNTALAYLAYNLVTMGKQLPSVLLYMPDAGPGHLLASMAEFAIHPFKTIEFANSRDPQMKHRAIEREMEELKAFDRNAFDRIIKKVGKTGMIGIYAMDKIATTIGWKAVYEADIKKGLSEEEAIREAQNVTLRTQPAAAPKDIAELYATNEYLNWFIQFTNQLNKIYNIATYDIPQTFKAHKYYKGLLQIVSMGLMSLGIWAISNRRLPEKPEDLVEAGKDTAINMIPLVGRGIASKSEGYFTEKAPPPLKAIYDMGTWLRDTGWTKKPVRDWFTDRRFIKKINTTLESLAVLFGIPYTGPKRIKKAIETGKVEELIGGGPKR